MLLRVILIQYITIASAAYDFSEKYSYSHSFPFQDLENAFLRTARGTKEKLAPQAPTCAHMKLTHTLPFIALMLLKTSGRFLGMGSIVDRESIITAFSVVKNTMESPRNLLTLAGRLNPWWGDGSQVYPAKFIYVHEYGVAIVRLVDPLMFSKYVKAIRLIPNNPKEYKEIFTRHWGVVGIPRGAWNVPGEPIERTSIYVMKVETEPEKIIDLKPCAATFPDVEFNTTVHTCTMANYTFGWGCQGSPTLAVDKKNKLQQIAVVTDAARTPDEPYHIHVKLGLLLNWIKAHTLIGFTEEDENN